jgi:hypothetical protein
MIGSASNQSMQKGQSLTGGARPCLGHPRRCGTRVRAAAPHPDNAVRRLIGSGPYERAVDRVPAQDPGRGALIATPPVIGNLGHAPACAQTSHSANVTSVRPTANGAGTVGRNPGTACGSPTTSACSGSSRNWRASSPTRWPVGPHQDRSRAAAGRTAGTKRLCLITRKAAAPHLEAGR